MKFGDYIRQQREHAGWTQPEAAARIDIEQSYLSKLETGKSYPSDEVFEKLRKTYSLNLSAMIADMPSDELQRLKEITDVRAALLAREGKQTRFMRSWLVAGLLMIMTGGVLLGLTQGDDRAEYSTYQYRSEGIIKEGESPMIFRFMESGKPDADGKTYTERVDYDFKQFSVNRGDHFFEKVEGGHRKYTLYNREVREAKSAMIWLLGPGLMFIFGGLASFYIARRWR